MCRTLCASLASNKRIKMAGAHCARECVQCDLRSALHEDKARQMLWYSRRARCLSVLALCCV
jgi:hypothetical protein